VPDIYSTTSDTGRFAAVLCLSLGLHLLFLLWLAERHVSESPREQPKRSVNIQLLSPQPARRDEPVLPDTTNQDSPVTAPYAADQEQAEGRLEPSSTQTPTAMEPPNPLPAQRERLNLSLPVIPSTESGAEPSASTIFDPTLTQRISQQRARSAPGRAGRLSSLDETASQPDFRGGRWQSFLRVGNLCFEVIEADPLEPLSNEQWYAVDCP
jgi:hypothetical protein